MTTPLVANDREHSITAHRIEDKPVIDGVLDELPWTLAKQAGNLRQVSGDIGDPATQATSFAVLYDDNSLYIGIWALDAETDKVVKRSMARDRALLGSDYLYFILDTFHDQRNAYMFGVNSIGGRYDALVDGTVRNENWNGVWTAKSSINETGWQTEVAIPFKSLSFDPSKSVWGFNLERMIRRRAENARWTRPLPHVFTYYPAEAGDLTNLVGMKQGLGVEFVPYALARYHRDDISNETSFEAGFDLRYRMTPNLSATVSYNMDFAETEVDQRVINFTRFPLLFPEKRAFFLEDSSAYSFGSADRFRRFRTPDLGGKLIGYRFEDQP